MTSDDLDTGTGAQGGGAGNQDGGGGSQGAGAGAGAANQGAGGQAGGADGQGGGDQGGAAANQGGGAGSWRDALPDNIRNNPALANVKDTGDLAQQFLNAQSVIGRRGLTLPGKDAPAEEWDKVWDTLGRPESPEGYKLPVEEEKLTDFDRTLKDKMLPAAHKAGLTQGQLEALVPALAETFQGMSAASTEAAEAKRAEAFDALKSRWGGQYDENLATAQKAVRGLGLEESHIDALSKALESDATVIEAMHRVGAAMGDMGGLPAGAGVTSEFSTPEAAKAEIQRIQTEASKDPQHPYTNRQHPEHKAQSDRMMALYQVAYPGQAAPG